MCFASCDPEAPYSYGGFSEAGWFVLHSETGLCYLRRTTLNAVEGGMQETEV